MVTIVASPARDFAFVCSNRFEIHRAAGRRNARPGRLASPSTGQRRARFSISPPRSSRSTSAGSVRITTTSSRSPPRIFGWNGNECSGLVLLDDRVMRLPSAGARYLDHLVTHETMHQWFWNVVGTDGYAETFMDEGLVNGLTAMRLDAKYGRNAPLIVWPEALSWLPTIGREDLRLAGYYGWRARGNDGSVIRDLEGDGQPGRPLQPGLRPRRQGHRDDPQPARDRPVLRLLPQDLSRLRLEDAFTTPT